MATPTELLDNLTRLRTDIGRSRDYAMAFAVGAFADDPEPEHQNVVALFYGGQLYSLAISDSFAAALAPDAVNPDREAIGLVISAVLGNAALAWITDYERLRTYADGVLAANPGATLDPV